MTCLDPKAGSRGSLRLSLMQPYFFPYLGYFSLIRHSDLWVVFDSPQFIKGGWIERNRILHPADGWCYIRVPLVKHPSSTPINQVKIRTSEPWREKLLAQVVHYKSAPYYSLVVSFLKDALDTTAKDIAALNVHLLEKCCRYLEMPFHYTQFSALPVSTMTAPSPDEWGLLTTQAFGAGEYLNAAGGLTFFDRSKYERAGIRLTFVRPRLRPYDQNRNTFQGGLSILDVMMFNDPRAIREMLDDVEFIHGGAVPVADSCATETRNG
jgi:hypothetical protein